MDLDLAPSRVALYLRNDSRLQQLLFSADSFVDHFNYPKCVSLLKCVEPQRFTESEIMNHQDTTLPKESIWSRFFKNPIHGFLISRWLIFVEEIRAVFVGHIVTLAVST